MTYSGGGERTFVKPDSPGWSVARAIALAIVAALQAFWFFQPAPLNLELLITAGLAVSLLRPAYGLVCFAAVAPLSTTIAGLCGDSSLGGRMLEQLALGVGAGALLHLAPADGRTWMGRPAWFVALVAVASAATLMPAAAAPVMRHLGDMSSPIWTPAFAGVTVAACALVAWAAERTIRRTPGLAAWVVMAGLASGAGAGALNLRRLVVAALRAPDVFHHLLRLLVSVRFNLQMDLNAGASTLILLGIAGSGLMGGSWARRIGIAFLVALVAVGVWITGSRIALAMAIVAGFAAIVWPAVRAGNSRRWLLAGAGVLVLGAGAWLVVSNPQRHSDRISFAVGFRRLMFDASVQMVKKDPIFGVGMHKFFDESEAYVGPALVKMGWTPRENAHNNFMQVLAEEGVVGFAAMLWWLGAVLIPTARAQLAQPDALRAGLWLAVAAAIGTWLTGHPLLVPGFAFVFWLYCGVLAATADPPAADRMRTVSWILTAALVLSIPFRGSALRDAAELEHRGFGVSALWQHDDTQRYRVAEGAFALYLPATGRPVEVPVRRASGAPEALVVEVRIAGEWVKQIDIAGDEWQSISLVLPAGSRRFVLVDFTVHDATSRAIVTGAALRVGRDRAR